MSAQRAAAVLLLVAAVGFAYSGVHRLSFVYFDDDEYVFENSVVAQGVTLQGIHWAFTTGHAGNWHPLTWISHMFDVSLFGLRPGPQHVVNLVLHGLNTLLLFWFLVRATGKTWCSAMVAALFAVHPLHVESVAWIAERKDVLSTAFLFLALLAYQRYAEKPSARRYAGIVAMFLLGLLSKPMVVTLPFLMLLLDYWPLERWKSGDAQSRAMRRLVIEKAPLFGIAALSSCVTYWVQLHGGAMHPLKSLPLTARIGNAIVAYGHYLSQTFWPTGLAILYPHPGESLSWSPLIGASLLLCTVTGLAVTAARNHPYIFTGWLWYLGMLIPVIGIVPIGYAARADRYTYVPLVGIFIALVWTADWALSTISPAHRRRARAAVISTCAVVLAMLAVLSREQVQVWRDSVSLFTHAIAATTNNAEAYTHLGFVYLKQQNPTQAAIALENAVALAPHSKEAHTNLGAAYRMSGRLDKAIEHYEIALQIDPEQGITRSNLGYALFQAGRFEEALQHLREAVRLDPLNASAHANLSEVLNAMGRREEAQVQRREAERLRGN